MKNNYQSIATKLLNQPNAKLAGTTFNSTHLDNFLKTENGLRQIKMKDIPQNMDIPKNSNHSFSNVR